MTQLQDLKRIAANLSDGVSALQTLLDAIKEIQLMPHGGNAIGPFYPPPNPGAINPVGAMTPVHPGTVVGTGTVGVAIASLPAGCALANIPNAPGLVYLTDLPVNSAHARTAFAILEVSKCFEAGSPEMEFILKNVNNANGMQRVSGSGAIFPACSTDFGVAPNFMGTIALPAYDQQGADKLGTVAAATKFYKEFKSVAPGGGSFVPGMR